METKDTAKKGNRKYLIGVIILAALAIIIFSIFPGPQPAAPTANVVADTEDTADTGANEGSLDGFARCLAEKGVKMYGAEWCPHCKNQKQAFGSSWQFIDYVECTERESECMAAGIEGYPTWVINGDKFPGEQSFAELSRQSGCKLQ